MESVSSPRYDPTSELKLKSLVPDYDALTFSWTQPTPSTTFPPPNLEFDTTIFPASSDMMLGAGLKIAAKLRATHSYTDAATFTCVRPLCRRASELIVLSLQARVRGVREGDRGGEGSEVTCG